MSGSQGRGRYPNSRGGRGGGRYSARGGRGHSRSRSSSSNSSLSRSNTSNSTKTKLEDHIYRIGTASQANEYVTVMKFVISHIREKYTKGGGEIAWALENEEEYDFSQDEPTMTIVMPEKEKPSYEEEMQQKQHQLKYQQQLSSYAEKIETYNNNRERAYGLLWNFTTSSVRSFFGENIRQSST